MERGGPIGIILGVLLLNCVSGAYIPQSQPSETNSDLSTTVGSFTHEVTTQGTPRSTSEGILGTTYKGTTASPILSSSTEGILAATTSMTTTLLTPNSFDKKVSTAGTSTVSTITDVATTTSNVPKDANSSMDSLDKKGKDLNMQSHELQMTSGGAYDMEVLMAKEFLLKLFYKLREKPVWH